MLKLKELLPEVSFFLKHSLAFLFSFFLKEHFFDHPNLFEFPVLLLAGYLSLMLALRFMCLLFRFAHNAKLLVFLNGFELTLAFDDLLLLKG